jgi:predicted O-methyltransferase YrrM
VILETLFPGFSDAPVTLTVLPLGIWSSSTLKQVVLTKLAQVIRARHILEIGSYRGYTARFLAENLSNAEIVSVDIDPRHGQAYLGSGVEGRIVRVVGSISAIPEGRKFDLIYVDAEHSYANADEDTRAALNLVAENGVIVWDDYDDWGWLSEANRVPEVVNAVARTVPVVRVEGVSFAIHRNGWTNAEVEAAIIEEDEQHSPAAVWESMGLRG